MVMAVPCMVMHVAVIVLVVNGFCNLVSIVSTHQKAPTSDSITVSPFETTSWKINSQILERLFKNLLRNSEIPERGNGHVAADSGKGIDMKEFHDGGILEVVGILQHDHSHLLSWETAMQKN
jgi:hypothetical protein